MTVVVGYSALALIIALPSQEMEELPSCGLMAVYTVAHHYQKDPSFAQVESLLGAGTGSDGGHSLEQVRMAVSSFGLHARSVRVTTNSLDHLNCPSIIYVRPERLEGDQSVGHFAVLQSVTGDVVQIVDLTRSPQPRDVARESLFAAWDGECLEISERTFLVPAAERWRLLCALVAVCSMVVLWRDLRKRRLVGNLAELCLACFTVGCGEPAGPAPLISFEKDTFSLGIVSRGPNADVPCHFVVGEEKVVITSIDSGCGCILPSDELLGEELPPGTAHSFVVTLNTVGRFGEFSGTLTLRTEPPSAEPIECRVSAYIDTPPEPVGTLPVRVETTWGNLAVAEIVLEHFRGHERPPVEWDEQRSDLAGFSVVRADFPKEQNSPTAGSMIGTGSRDLFLWGLRAPEDLVIGWHSFELTFAWKDDYYPAQRVPVEVNVSHPIRTSLDRVFFGVIEKGTSRVVDVNVTNWDAEEMRTIEVESDVSFVVATLNAESGFIRIELSRLAPVGRLEANVHIRNQHESPELVIPVTAVITDSQAVSSDI